MNLGKALEAAAANLEVDPALLWQKEPRFAGGLNSDAINKAAGKSIIEQHEQVDDNDPGLLKPYRFLRFNSLDGDSLEILVGGPYGPPEMTPRYLLDCRRAVAILHEWAESERRELSPPTKAEPKGKPARRTIGHWADLVERHESMTPKPSKKEFAKKIGVNYDNLLKMYPKGKAELLKRQRNARRAGS